MRHRLQGYAGVLHIVRGQDSIYHRKRKDYASADAKIWRQSTVRAIVIKSHCQDELAEGLRMSPNVEPALLRD